MTFQKIKNDPKLRAFIKASDDCMISLGFTEHSFAHVGLVAEKAGYIMETLGFDPHMAELARIAGYLHDIGNLVNRVEHSQSGAIIAMGLLEDWGFAPEDVALVVSAIGNHDEGTGAPVNSIAAALILADKSDVRRTRVREKELSNFDIHDRVNFSVQKAELKINEEKTQIHLRLSVDTDVSPVMEYFEIFLDRMILCRKAAEKLGLEFKLSINELALL